MIKIIDNKKVRLTEAEYNLYKSIASSYDRPDGFKGSELFKELFETDNNGNIIFIRPPPNNRPVTMEVYMFLISIMVHQHIGGACFEVDEFLKEARQVLKEMKQTLQDIKGESNVKEK